MALPVRGKVVTATIAAGVIICGAVYCFYIMHQAYKGAKKYMSKKEFEK